MQDLLPGEPSLGRRGKDTFACAGLQIDLMHAKSQLLKLWVVTHLNVGLKKIDNSKRFQNAQKQKLTENKTDNESELL